MSAPIREGFENTILPCSFRGVRFFWESGSIVGGRKATEAPVIFSDEQLVSDVGKRARAYSIRGIIAARTQPDASGSAQTVETYAQARRSLLEALESGTPGTFIHPIEGTVTGLVARSWSLDETFSELGIGRIGIEFILDTSRATPVVEVGAADLVAERAEVARETALDAFAARWNISPAIVNAYDEGLASTRSAFAAIQRSADEAQTTASGINGFAAAIAKGTADAARLIQTPLLLARSISGAFQALRSVYPTAKAALDGLALGFEYGDFDLVGDTTTNPGRLRQANSDAMRAAMRIMFLTNAYEAAAAISYLTLDDVDEVDRLLAAQHVAILGLASVDAETADELEKLRAAFSELLGAARLTAYRLTRESIAPTTPRALAFALYGSDELAPNLAALNGRYSYELLDGDVTVLSL
jgi:prophage DNA circulation protein